MRILTILTLAVFVLNTGPALAALNNGSPSGTLAACSTGIAAGASCRATPTKYQVTIYELGLCSEHPFGTNTAGVNGSTVTTMDKSTCSPAFTNTAGNTVDIAQFVNGSVDEIMRHGQLISGQDALDFIASAKEITGANLINNEYGHPLFADFFFFDSNCTRSRGRPPHRC